MSRGNRRGWTLESGRQSARRVRFAKTLTVCLGLGVAVAACSVPPEDRAAPARAGDLPPLQQTEIGSLQRPDPEHMTPVESTDPGVNPDAAFLLVFTDPYGMVVGVKQGGVIAADPAARACYEAIQRTRLEGQPLRADALPRICQRADVRLRKPR